jgi:hypothetical protein
VSLSDHGDKSESTFTAPPRVEAARPRLRFLRSSSALPNIRMSDFVGFVEARNAANRMNFDMRGRTSVSVPWDVCGTDLSTRFAPENPLESKFRWGWLSTAHSAAFDSRGYKASSAVVKEGVNNRIRRIRASSVGAVNSNSSSSSPGFSRASSSSRRYSSRIGVTNPGHRAAAI